MLAAQLWSRKGSGRFWVDSVEKADVTRTDQNGRFAPTAVVRRLLEFMGHACVTIPFSHSPQGLLRRAAP